MPGGSQSFFGHHRFRFRLLHQRGANFVRDTQATWRKGIEISTDGYACPCPQGPDGPRLESQSATLIVQSYHLYYRRPAERQAWLRRIPLSSPRRLPFSETDLGWGLQPFSFYTTQGKKLASELDLFEVRARAYSLVLHLRGSHRHRGQVAPETIDLEFVASPRNGLRSRPALDVRFAARFAWQLTNRSQQSEDLLQECLSRHTRGVALADPEVWRSVNAERFR